MGQCWMGHESPSKKEETEQLLVTWDVCTFRQLMTDNDLTIAGVVGTCAMCWLFVRSTLTLFIESPK